MSVASVEEWIRERVRCCACGGSLKNSKHINILCLDKLATWKYPCWGNVLVMDKYPMNRASAILCDSCIKEGRQAKYAIEWDNEHTYVRYHLVKKLKDLPHIPEEEVLRAEAITQPENLSSRNPRKIRAPITQQTKLEPTRLEAES